MDGKLLLEVYHRLFPSPASVAGRRCLYSDAVVALIQFFAALTNHSLRWARDKRNWPLWARRLRFPSYSRLCRRAKSPSVRRLVESVGSAARGELPDSSEKALDGKALVVGGYSKDPDARRGKVPAGWAKGYKLHALVDACGAVDAWAVTPLDAGEATVARGLLDEAGAGAGLAWVVVRGDPAYDSNALYARAADAGAVLIAPRCKPGTGLGHHPHHPDRLRAIARLEGAGPWGEGSPWGEGAAGHLKEHRRHRNRIEQAFGHLTNVPFGLWALPNHVRRLERVSRWVGAKLALYHLYLVLLRRARAADSAAA